MIKKFAVYCIFIEKTMYLCNVVQKNLIRLVYGSYREERLFRVVRYMAR